LEEDLTGAGMSMSFCAQNEFLTQQNRVTYKFTHGDWRKNILKVVLDSWKREMYRLLAESLEERFDAKSKNLDRAIRQLLEPFSGGKKKVENLGVASELALKIGEQMTCVGKARYSLQIYQKALDLWLQPDKDDGMVLVMEDEDGKNQSGLLPLASSFLFFGLAHIVSRLVILR
jgi:DNA-binding transcriptional ArsR family regulator